MNTLRINNAGDLKQLSMDQTVGEDNRKFLHTVTHVFDNSNLSQEIFAVDAWRAIIYSLGHGGKHMLAILPTIARVTRGDWSDRFFCIHARSLCKFLKPGLHILL